MRSFFSTVMLVLIICFLASCNMFSSASNSNVSKSALLQSSSAASTSSSTSNVQKAPKTAEFIGTPDKIILVKGEKETVFEPKTKEYLEIIKKLQARFPEILKESSMLFEWKDVNNNIDWQLMAKDFDYIRLSYNDIQNANIEVKGVGSNFNREVSFQDLTFPLSSSKAQMCIVGKTRSFGILDYYDDTLSDLLNYPQSSSQSSSSLDNLKTITKPTDIIGTPSKVVYVKNKKETIFEPQTKEYSDIIKMLEARFPEKLRQSILTNKWLDKSNNIDWQLVARDDDYIRLSYDDIQNVRFECMDRDSYTPEVSFQDIAFPLGNYNNLCFVGTSKAFGYLDHSLDTLKNLQNYY